MEKIHEKSHFLISYFPPHLSLLHTLYCHNQTHFVFSKNSYINIIYKYFISNTIGCWRTQNCTYHSCPRLVTCNLTKLLNNFVFVCTWTFMSVANNSSGCHKSCPKLAACQFPPRSPVFVSLRYCHYAMACRHWFPLLSALQVGVIDII